MEEMKFKVEHLQTLNDFGRFDIYIKLNTASSAVSNCFILAARCTQLL